MKKLQKRNLFICMIATSVVITTITGCSGQATSKEQPSSTSEETLPEQGTENIENSESGTSEEIAETAPDYTPSVAPYQTEKDFSNIENAERFYLQDHIKEKLATNNFVVVDSTGNEFFDLYEMNRYMQIPNFITVDSMMHTYHLYFAMLQKNTEKNYLFAEVEEMSKTLQEASMKQYDELNGTEWEDAAKINVAFFTVGAVLIGEDITIPDYVKSIVDSELKMIQDASEVEVSPLTDSMEDYSQYKPRGYYDGDENLEKYFRTLMWYGRRNFAQKDEKMDRSALLMTLLTNENAKSNWEKVYSITAFFAGTSDDSGINEYLPLIEQAYGENISTKDLIENQSAFDTYHQLTGELDPPAINSEVFPDDEGETDKTIESKGYRFMGQRFTLDASIFTQLCYSKVKADDQGNKRMLPDSLDVPAAMGSDVALKILEEDGNFAYQGYQENMEKVRNNISNAPSTIWSSSLYGQWLNTLRPILKEKKDGYPSFMVSDEWTKKNLEGFLSSFTELKHDTVLYSKQFVAEMGGGDEVFDDRGYVEPEVEVYRKLSSLTKQTADGLENFNIISGDDLDNLKKLSDLSDRLADISVKELTGAEVSEDDYEFIRSYGGSIEHFWKETVKDQSTEEYISSCEFPAALVVDVATDPNGVVLEQAIGGVSAIYVIVPIDGKLRIAEGGVFSYYQFIQPSSDRLTDSKWRQMIGLELTDDMEYATDDSITQPEWTNSYRAAWEYSNE